MEIEALPLEELPPGTMRLSRRAGARLYNCGGELFAIEDRCSHDDGPLCEGDWDPDGVRGRLPAARRPVRPRTGNALSLPAYMPVERTPYASATTG